MVKKLPLKLIRRTLKEYVKGEITQESIIYVRDVLDNVLCQLGEDSIKELDKSNRLRQIQGLPKLKRYPVSVFIKLSDELFNQPPDFKFGEAGQYNNETVCSEANEVV